MTLRTYYTQRGMREIGARCDSGLNCRSCGEEWTPATATGTVAILYHEPECVYLQQWHEEQAVRDDHAALLLAGYTPEEAYEELITNPECTTHRFLSDEFFATLPGAPTP